MDVKHLLGLENLGRETIEEILDTVRPMRDIMHRPIKKVPTLRGRMVVTLFYEASTRTRVSFEMAAKYLGGDTVSVAAASSSVSKGEGLKDTARTLNAMRPDVIVLRHPMAGAAAFLARETRAHVINAGDGAHEHPTQALLDLFTVREARGRIEGLKLAIIGDVAHSRVARSNIWGFSRLGAEVYLAGPATLMPEGVEHMGAHVVAVEEALADADVVMVLRLQLERQKQGLLPDLSEYTALFGLDRQRLELARADAVVMHPGPVNRGVEIMPDVADGPRSVITDQVENGVALRMAVLYLLTGGRSPESIGSE